MPRRRSDQAPRLLGPEFVTTNSLTKVYGLSGLRCGWVLAEPALAQRMTRLNDLFGVNQAHQAERLACIAFDNIDAVIGRQSALLAPQSRLVQRLRRWPRRSCHALPLCTASRLSPAGAAGNPESARRAAPHAFSTRRSCPADGFEAPDHFRVGLGLPTALFEEALDRLGQGLETSSRAG